MLHVLLAMCVALVYLAESGAASSARSPPRIGRYSGVFVLVQILLVVWPYLLSWGILSRRQLRSVTRMVSFAAILGVVTAGMLGTELGMIWSAESSPPLILVTLVAALVISFAATIIFPGSTILIPQTSELAASKAKGNKQKDSEAPAWICKHCGEENPPTFDECWKCQKIRPGKR